MNVIEAYTNFVPYSTDGTLFNVHFVLAASAKIHNYATINITQHNIFTFLSFILKMFEVLP
jgi:hypothetical protein